MPLPPSPARATRSSTDDQRVKGFVDQMKAKYPNITVLPTQFADHSAQETASKVSAILAANPDLNGVFAVDNFTGDGAPIGVYRRPMEEPRATPDVLRIVDGDERSLARRVDHALSGLPDGSRVDHFTYWYTGRPPIHEATVSPPAPDEPSA